MKMKSNDKKITNIIIIILTIVIIALFIIILNTKDKNVDKTENTTENIITSTTESIVSDDNNQVTEEVKATDSDSSESNKRKSDCYVIISNTNSWESEGKKSGQLDVNIVNNSNENIKNWEIRISLSSEISIDSSWNGEFTMEDNNIIIKPVDYNSEVMAQTTLKDIGFIVTAATDEDIKYIEKNVVLYVDGKEYVSKDTTEEADDNNDATESEKKEIEEAEEVAKTEADNNKSDDIGKTPFEKHGKITVSGKDIVDAHGEKFQLKGVSTHGIAWFPDYVNKDAFSTFRDDWDANLIRIAMYTDENGGYCNGGDKEQLKSLVKKGVEDATALGLYVIIDWHVLRDCDPNKYKEDAAAFFEEMSSEYKDYDNVIYEICNEPNGGTSWESIKKYAEEIIPIIRSNSKDAIIIVGTPNWSQDVDIASTNPITGYDNIMYAVHFYAATHTDNIRNKVVTALDNNLPIFVSEFSICDASGDGAIDYNQADKWFELINNNNLSYAGWNISNKNESSSLIKSSCSKIYGWSDDELSETGIWLKKQIKGN